MRSCEGRCHCGKGIHRPTRERLTLAQRSTSQEMFFAHDLQKGLGTLTVKEELVEVRFKSNRKAFYRNNRGLRLQKDDRVVVHIESGHDLGTIGLSGDLAEMLFEQKYKSSSKSSLPQVSRKATPEDLQRWLIAKRRERELLLESRKIAYEFQPEICIADVEIRGDGKKVYLYYTADGRFDHQIMMKKYANAFNLQIEMNQVGIPQSAGNFEEKAPGVN